MTPADFADVVVIPTVRDSLAHRGDRRRACLACIADHHLVDHVAHAEGQADDEVGWSAMKREAGLSFEAVHGIVDAIERPRPAHAKRFSPRGETPYPVFSFDVRGLEGEVNGQCLFIDMCVGAVFRAFVASYLQHLGRIDRPSLDEQFRLAADPAASDFRDSAR